MFLYGAGYLSSAPRATDTRLPLASLRSRWRGLPIGQLLDLAGENLDNAEMVAHFLGTRSIRLVSLFLMNLKSTFTVEESLMIKYYFSGVSVPDEIIFSLV